MTVGLYGEKITAESAAFLKTFLKMLAEKHIDFQIHERFYNALQDHLKPAEKVGVFAGRETLSDLDLLFTFGGDGTILRAATLVYNTGIPLAGVNMGRLGFLASYKSDELLDHLDAIAKGEYQVSERALLSVSLDKRPERLPIHFALNEVTVSRKASSSMISIRTRLNEEFLNTYWADGLIVSTPTGSTAYSLSCGGPILMPQNDNIALTPIAPHNLNVRPVILSDESEIKLQVTSREREFLVTLDSSWVLLDTATELTIKKAPCKVKIIYPRDCSFLNTLRNKLHWGADLRN